MSHFDKVKEYLMELEYSITKEDRENEVFVVYSDRRYMDVGQELVKMLHGELITEEKEAAEIRDENIKQIFEKAKKFNEQGVPWHHHMFFPNCTFNKHEGQWCIVFEDREENKVIEYLSKEEPKSNLRAIEALYYKQKK